MHWLMGNDVHAEAVPWQLPTWEPASVLPHEHPGCGVQAACVRELQSGGVPRQEGAQVQVRAVHSSCLVSVEQ